jgi:hypothetical protein
VSYRLEIGDRQPFSPLSFEKRGTAPFSVDYTRREPKAELG